MTFARVYGTGSGALRFRLSIEGWPYEFVTNADMVTTTADGRQRIVGLSVEGMKISQRADLVRSTVEAQGVSVKLVDVGQGATAAFALAPEDTTWLAANATTTDTDIQVLSTAGFAAAGYIHVNTECIQYTGLGASPARFTGCTRGRWDTLAQAHYIPNAGLLRYPQITSTPAVMEGRRARIFAYGSGDSDTGDGTQIFLGVISGEPRMSGPTWSISIDPISRILAQELGADLGDSVTPRGIYYSSTVGGAWRLMIGRSSSGSGAVLTYFNTALISFPTATESFWETQQDFINSVNAQLTTATAGWNATIQCKPGRDGGYYFEISQNTPVDSIGMMIETPRCDLAFVTNEFSTTEDGPPATAAERVDHFNTNTDYYWFPSTGGAELASKLPGAGLVPRGHFRSTPVGTAGLGSEAAALAATYPATRVYLGGAVALTSNTTAVLIDWEDPGGASVSRAYAADVVDTAARSVDLGRTFSEYRLIDEHDFTPTNLPRIRLGRSYSSFVDGVGNLANLLESLSTDSGTQVNTGAQPVIRTTGGPVIAPGDIDQAAWDAAMLSAETSIIANRSYQSFAAVSLEELIAPELQLAGHFLAFDEFGRLIPKRLRLATGTEVGIYQITKANLLTDDGFPRYEKGAVGKYSTLVVRDGYDAVEDEYTLPSIIVRDVSAFGQTPNSRTITIEPKSRYFGRGSLALEDVVRVAANVLGIFGGPYAHVTLSVPLTGVFFTALGSTVSVTTRHLPSVTGVRGVTDLLGLVIAREIDLYGARIELTLLVSTSRIVGYAPAARITSQTNTSGNTWSVVLSSAWFANGETAADHFLAGENVRVFRYDSTSAGEIAATVTSSSGNTVVISVSSTWTPSTDSWVLGFDKSTADPAGSRQLNYGYVAASDGRYSDSASNTYPASEFAP